METLDEIDALLADPAEPELPPHSLGKLIEWKHVV
jgi:hypothetical protein